MTKRDSLDNITLDSDGIRTIERFEHKNNTIQKGGGGSNINNNENNLEDNLKEIFKNVIKIVFDGINELELIKLFKIPTQSLSVVALTPPLLAPTLPPRPSKLIGGNTNTNTDKLKKNIVRLYNCYVLSQNQNGGIDNKLYVQVKKRLDKKIAELIVYKNYLKNYIGEGGIGNEDQQFRQDLLLLINNELPKHRIKINNFFTSALLTNILTIDDKNNKFKDIKIPNILEYIPESGVLISGVFFKLIIKDLKKPSIKHQEGGRYNYQNIFNIDNDLEGGYTLGDRIRESILTAIGGIISVFPGIVNCICEVISGLGTNVPDISKFFTALSHAGYFGYRIIFDLPQLAKDIKDGR